MSDKSKPVVSIKPTVQVEPAKVIKVQVETQKNKLDPSKIRTLGNQKKKWEAKVYLQAFGIEGYRQ